MGVPVGLKDLNTTADLMESFADLHEISPDAVLKARLQELFHILRDRGVVAPGLVHYYFQPDWTPVPELYRCAYALNTSNLLVRAERALDPEPETAQVVKSLVDMALRFAWDDSQEGFMFAGSPFGPTWVGDIKLFVGEKIWWPQAEAMRAILRLGQLHPDDDMHYLRRFDELWTFIKQYLIDRRNGGWSFVGRDSTPLRKQPKATMWKDLSHESHALMSCLQMLRG